MRSSRFARALWLLALVLIVSAGFAAITLAGKPLPWKRCTTTDDCGASGLRSILQAGGGLPAVRSRQVSQSNLPEVAGTASGTFENHFDLPTLHPQESAAEKHRLPDTPAGVPRVS
jgi:hypothetical protein